MRKPVVCVFVLLLAAAAVAQQRDLSKVQIKTTKLAGSVYMLQGAGGNMAASIGDDGIVLIDDQFAPLVPKIEEALKAISPKPLRFVINTHFHSDHVGGNAVLQQQAPIIAQENVRARLESGTRVLGRAEPVMPKSGVPELTFSDSLTLHMNGEEIRVVHFPRAHTDGDAIIFFPQAKVVHMGDIYVTYGFPFIDLENGGGVRGMIAAVAKVIATVPPDTKVIPGHGELETMDHLKAYLAMLKDCTARVEKGIQQGKTLQQLQQENVLAGYESLGGPGKFITTDKFIETLYKDATENP